MINKTIKTKHIKLFDTFHKPKRFKINNNRCPIT